MAYNTVQQNFCHYIDLIEFRVIAKIKKHDEIEFRHVPNFTRGEIA